MKKYIVALLLITLGLIVGCQGNTSGGSQAGDGDVFVSGDATTGRVELDLNSTSVPVANTTGFRFFVFDKDNRPVENIRVVCDSEKEIAIIEPTDGFETTDSFGGISGLIGCRAPGSYLFGCRTAGASKRKFITVICTGDVPAGFDGFPGAAGGGLGGGTLPPGSGGPGGGGTDNIRIIDIDLVTIATPDGASGAPQIDTTGDLCDTEGTPGDTSDDTAEIFGDDLVTLTVKNGSSSLVRFTHINYTVENGVTPTPGDVESPDLAITGELEANADGTVTLSSFFTDANSSTKTYADGATVIPANLGIRNVTFRLYGLDGNDEEFVVERTIAINFDAYNNCE